MDGNPEQPNVEKYVDLVFSGGGPKGIALVGALSVLEEQGYQPQNRAGTSAGAVVAALNAAGYTAADLRDVIAGENFSRFMDVGWEDRIPFVGPELSIFLDEGIYEGKALLERIRELLAAKNVRTFGDLIYDAETTNPIYRYKVQLIASDLTAHRILFLPKDAKEVLGVEPDELEVAEAVRMSASIPLFFEPVWFRNPITREEHLIVDGALLSNFPVEVFDAPDVPAWPTFGVRLVEDDPNAPLGTHTPPTDLPHGGVEGVWAYVKNVVQTLLEAHDRLYLDNAKFVRTITIPTLGLSSENFNLTAKDAQALYEAGRTAAGAFLATWNFPGYVAEFRSGKEHRRRLELAVQLRQAASAAADAQPSANASNEPGSGVPAGQ